MTKNEAIELAIANLRAQKMSFAKRNPSNPYLKLILQDTKGKYEQAITILEGLKEKEDKNERGTETVSV